MFASAFRPAKLSWHGPRSTACGTRSACTTCCRGPFVPSRMILVEVALGGGSVLSRVTADAVARLGLALGTPVLALIKSMSVEVLGGAAGAPRRPGSDGTKRQLTR